MKRLLAVVAAMVVVETGTAQVLEDDLIRNPFGVEQLDALQTYHSLGHDIDLITESGWAPGQYSSSFVFRFSENGKECVTWIEVAHTGLIPPVVFVDTCEADGLTKLGELVTAFTGFVHHATETLRFLHHRFNIQNVDYFAVKGSNTYFFKVKDPACKGDVVLDGDDPVYSDNC